MSDMNFFNKPLEFIDDLTKVPGKKELVKPKAPKKTYNCNDCGRCKHVDPKKLDKVGVYGKGNKNILIITDEATEYAMEEQKPVVGTDSKFLKALCKEVGLDLYEDTYVINAIQGTGDPKQVGVAGKACRKQLHNTIDKLKPKIIIPMGFRALSVLWGDRLSITNEFEKWYAVDKNMATPDQRFPGSWVIPTYGINTFIYILKNQLAKAKQWAKEAERSKGMVPKYLAEKIDPSISIVDKKTLRNDEFNLKYRWLIRDFNSALYHLEKDAPIDDSEQKVEKLHTKKEIHEGIEYFKKQRVVACDIETSTITPHREKAEILCISFSNIHRTISYMTRDKEVIEWTKELLTTRSVQYIFHNATFEIKQFKMLWGIMVDNLYVDSQILAHCFDSRAGTSSLKKTAMTYLGIAEYEKNSKKFFKVAPEDKGTIYEKSNQSYNCLPLGLERGKLYEKGLLFPLDGTDKRIKEENKRRNKILNDGVLTEDELLLYCGMDTLLTCKITQEIKKRLMDQKEWEAVQFYSKSSITLTKISMNGVKVDREKLVKNIKILEGEAEEMHKEIMLSPESKAWTKYIDEEISKLVDSDDKEDKKKLKALKDKRIINYGSGAQLGTLLFDVLKHPGGKRTKTGWATNEAVLEQVDSPMCKTILARKKLLKAKVTYLDGILRELNDEDIAMPSYSLALVSSFRSSCQNFNFQNQIKHNERLMKMIRECIIPHGPDSVFSEGDYSSCEAYAASIISGDKVYFKYNTEKSADIHKFVAFTLFGLDSEELKDHTKNGVVIKAPKKLFKKLRQISKTYTFASSYGGGYYNIAEDIWESLSTLDEEDKLWLEAQLKTIGITNKEKFREQVKFVDETVWGKTMFYRYGLFKKEQYETYKKQGYLRNACGFVYRDQMSSMACANYPVQSIAFMKLMHALNLLQEEIEKRGLKSKIVGEIHDSVTLDIKKEEMEEIKKLLVDTMIHGTNGVEMFDWVTMEFKVDLDIYESSWGSDCEAVRLDPENYTKNYVAS